jgi:Tol biopolymer transport system component
MRFSYEPPNDQPLGSLLDRAFAVSPDGKSLVYKTEKGLLLRAMAELNARLISGTEGNPQKPFFSPDGQWI